MIFQTQITELDSELSQLQALLNSVQQRRNLYSQFQQQTDGYLKGLSELKDKLASSIGTDAIASLKSAVVSLFVDDGNDGGGNEPTEPTPPDNPDSDEADEPELLCLNGLTGDFLLSSDEPEEDNPVCPEGEHILESNAPFIGQVCHINPDLYWAMTSTPDGSSWDFATPICCLLEDCPESSLIGQSYELCSLIEDKPAPYIEFITHPDNAHVAYQRKRDGEIICTYVGFRTKAIAQSWREFVEALAFHVELRQSKRMQGFKWELLCKGISMQQIDRLAKNCDLAKSHRTEVCSSLPPSYKKLLHPTPVVLDEVKPGDIVSPLLAPGDSYEVIQVMPNGILDCKSLRTGVQMGLKPTAVTLVQKAVIQKPEAQRHQLQSGDRVVKSGVVHSRSAFHFIPADELVRVSLLPEAATGDDAFDF